jgi:hypothetical protein
MFPTLRVDHAIPAEHEVGGLGEAGPALPVMDTANLKWPGPAPGAGAGGARGRAGPSGHRASHRHLGRRWRSWVGGVSVDCGSRRRHCRISSRILSYISIC